MEGEKPLLNSYDTKNKNNKYCPKSFPHYLPLYSLPRNSFIFQTLNSTET